MGRCDNFNHLFMIRAFPRVIIKKSLHISHVNILRAQCSLDVSVNLSMNMGKVLLNIYVLA